jgi:hypothetical protein
MPKPRASTTETSPELSYHTSFLTVSKIYAPESVH